MQQDTEKKPKCCTIEIAYSEQPPNAKPSKIKNWPKMFNMRALASFIRNQFTHGRVKDGPFMLAGPTAKPYAPSRRNKDITCYTVFPFEQDEGPPLEEVLSKFRKYEYVAWPTYNDGKDGANKYRMLFSLSRPIQSKDELTVVHDFIMSRAAKFGVKFIEEGETQDWGRLWYLPRSASHKWNPVLKVKHIQGIPIDVDAAITWHYEEFPQVEERPPEPKKRKDDDNPFSPINGLNSEYAPEDVLFAHGGYDYVGSSEAGMVLRFSSPFNPNSPPGVMVFRDTGKVFSHHAGGHCPIYNGANGCARDTFDLARVLWFDGDMKRALNWAKAQVAAGGDLDPSLGAGEDIGVDYNEKTIKEAKEAAAKQIDVPSDAYDHLIPSLPPVIRAVYTEIIEAAVYPQKAFALFTAIWLAASAVNRSAYLLSSGPIFPNMIVKLLGKTGCGKDFVVKYARRALGMGGLYLPVASTIGSAAGLEDALLENEGMLFYVKDEARPQNGDTYMALVDKENEYFSSTGGLLIPRKLSSRNKDNGASAAVEGLYYSKLAATTVDAHFDASSYARAVSGEAGRMFIVYSSDHRPDGNFSKEEEVDLPVVNKRFSRWADKVNPSLFEIDIFTDEKEKWTPRVLRLTPDAFDTWVARQIDIDEKLRDDSMPEETRAMASRLGEHTKRLALVFTLAKDPAAETVGQESMELAIELMRTYANITRPVIERHTSRNALDKMVNELCALAHNVLTKPLTKSVKKKYGEEDHANGFMPASYFSARLKLTPKLMEEVVAAGVGYGNIIVTDRINKKNSEKSIRLIGLKKKQK